jgi:hypothetical protein
MAKDTIIVALNGDTVTLQDFAKTITRFQTLICQLATEIAPRTRVNWLVTHLETGSAIAEIRGCPEREDQIADVEQVTEAYLRVGYSLREGTQFPYSRKVRRAAKEMLSVVNGHITSVRFENSDDDVEVSRIKISKSRKIETPVQPRQPHIVYGAMRGRVQCLSSRGTLRFTLYDLVDDKAVSCYLPPGNENIMRDAWGKIAVVEGKIHRNEETGRASTIRDVSQVRVLPECKQGEWREALGAAPGFLGSTLPEEVVRRSRDD